jgi:dTDP-4-dehydrorhamnose reductase
MTNETLQGCLITGATGQVGGELVNLLNTPGAPFGPVYAPARAELDLGDTDSVRRAIRTLRPRWILNPGAYTAVDKAESEPELAYRVNRDAVAAIGEEARTLGAAVVHFSTDYVFSGDSATPYVETDATGPQGVYGASKLAGEQALLASGAAAIILRTSWVYGATGKNFLRTILRLAREREQMKIVDDQFGAPTWSRDLAQLVGGIVTTVEERRAGESGIDQAAAHFRGIYHATGQGRTSWFGFAEEGLRRLRLREPQTRFAELLPISTAEYPTPARRPANSSLDCAKLQETFGRGLLQWQASVAAVVDEL